MLILLPPSETKRSGGGAPYDPETLAFASSLSDTRRLVRAALEDLSRDPEAASKPLKLGKKNAGELSRNLCLGESGAMPAAERYTGVLYDSLEVGSLGGARRWLDRSVMVQSALFGLIRADDRIPAYRLSAGSRLPLLHAPLKRVWAEAHSRIEWQGPVLDLRSKDYVALAPVPAGIGAFVNVVQRGADGEVRALNHFNKAAKGALVRRLALAAPDIDSIEELIVWATENGIEVYRNPDDSSGTLTLVAESLQAASHRTGGAR